MSRPTRQWFRLASTPRGPSPTPTPELGQVRPSLIEPVFTTMTPNPILQIQPIRDPVPSTPAITQPALQPTVPPLETTNSGPTTTTFETIKPQAQTPSFYEPIKPKYEALAPPPTPVSREPETRIVSREPESKTVSREPETKIVSREPESKTVSREPETRIVSREPESRIPLESEQKTVLYQKTMESAEYKDFDKSLKYGFNGSRREELHKDGDHQDRHLKHKNGLLPKKNLDSDDWTLGQKIITLAGENKGAFMEVIRTPKRQEDQTHVFYKNGHRLGEELIGGENKNELEKGVKSDQEGSTKGQKMKGIHGVPITSFTNSNVQGVNNSIMFNASCTHHDPGVHLVLSRKPNGKGIKVKEHISDHHGAQHS